MNRERRDGESALKEVLVVVSLMCVGSWGAQSGVEWVGRLLPTEEGLTVVVSDPRLASFDPDQEITRSDMTRYKRLYHTSSQERGTKYWR